MIDIQWMTCFLDRPTARFERTVGFWREVLASELSTWRGDTERFATLLPPSGDAYMRVQRVDGGAGGSHLDLHVIDVRASAEEAARLGAEVVADLGTLVVMRSPAGFAFCVSGVYGSGVRPPAVIAAGAAAHSLLDQLTVDVPLSVFERECEFWQQLTGWPLTQGARDEFRFLARPDGMPLRLMLQRCDDERAGATGHPDLACESIDDVAAAHQRLGATVVARRGHWITMADPSGTPYCLTPRNPFTGLFEG